MSNVFTKDNGFVSVNYNGPAIKSHWDKINMNLSQKEKNYINLTISALERQRCKVGEVLTMNERNIAINNILSFLDKDIRKKITSSNNYRDNNKECSGECAECSCKCTFESIREACEAYIEAEAYDFKQVCEKSKQTYPELFIPWDDISPNTLRFWASNGWKDTLGRDMSKYKQRIPLKDVEEKKKKYFISGKATGEHGYIEEFEIESVTSWCKETFGEERAQATRKKLLRGKSVDGYLLRIE